MKLEVPLLVIACLLLSLGWFSVYLCPGGLHLRSRLRNSNPGSSRGCQCFVILLQSSWCRHRRSESALTSGSNSLGELGSG